MNFSITATDDLFSVTLQGESLPDLAQRIAALVAKFKGAPAEDAPQPDKTNTKAGKGNKAQTPAPAPEPEQTDLEEAANNAPPTHDEMVTKLGELNATKGMQAVRDILAQFGCKKLNEPKEDQRQAIIDAAEKAKAA